MAGPRTGQRPPGLLGREHECAAIDRLLADAQAGAAGALVVRGEPGIGKSALLSYARQHAPLMLVLSAGGVEAESDLAFAGLHELLRPVLSYLNELPGIQSQALAGALGLAPPRQPDRLLIGAAVLGLLAAAAQDPCSPVTGDPCSPVTGDPTGERTGDFADASRPPSRRPW